MMRFLGIEGNRDCYSPDQAKSITVGKLKEILEWFDDELPVYLINDRGYTYGSLSESDIEEHTINNQGELDEEDYEEDDEDFEEHYTCKRTMKEYTRETPELYDNYDWANYLTKALNLNSYDSETLIQDLNNLRADEWLDIMVSDNVPSDIINKYKKFFHIDDDEDLDESYDTFNSTIKKIRDLEVGDIILNSVGDRAEIVEIGEEGSVCTVDRYGNLDTQEFEELEDEDIEVFHHYNEKDVEESCSSMLHIRERAIKEEFSGYDVRSLLDQIEAKWGFDTMDKMLDWLVEYSDNGNDQLDEYGYYVPEELEFWIGNHKIEDVMTRCLETGRIEESLRSQRRHMHESHRVRKNKLYIKKSHKQNDKISKY